MKKFSFLILSGLILFLSIESMACTTFIISGKHTIDGKSILFKNRDTKEMNNALVLFSDGKYKYMGVVNATEERWNKAVWGGYNETGFAIINSAAYNNNVGDTTKYKDQEGAVMKKALMVCASIKDFEHFLDTLPKPLGVNANFGVIDAYGGAAYYETGNYKYVKYDANDPDIAPDGIIIRTNHSMSGDLSKGFGFNRFENATLLLNKACEEKNLTAQHLLKSVPRSLYHPRTKTDLSVNIPEKRDVPEYEFFIDYIPRVSTASTFLIVGAKDAAHAEDAMMWTILGFPLTSVAVPAWLSTDEIPKVLSMEEDYTAPICNAALNFKKECFPIEIDKGTNYIDLSVILNQEGNGYWQLLQPIEDKIFEKANVLMSDLENGKKSKKDILDFYKWIDKYLKKSYKKNFKYDLFE